MAEVIPFEDVVRARRRDAARSVTATCCEIVEASLQRTLVAYHGAEGPERRVRARQVRQLAELLEYLERTR